MGHGAPRRNLAPNYMARHHDARMTLLARGNSLRIMAEDDFPARFVRFFFRTESSRTENDAEKVQGFDGKGDSVRKKNRTNRAGKSSSAMIRSELPLAKSVILASW